MQKTEEASVCGDYWLFGFGGNTQVFALIKVEIWSYENTLF